MFYRRFAAAVLFGLILLPISAKDYTITEDELIAFEQILLDYQRYKHEAETALKELMTQLAESEQLTIDLEISFREYASEARKIAQAQGDRIRILERNRWIERGVFVAVLIAIALIP